jgi:8-oxo-dGTP diphosphatase
MTTHVIGCVGAVIKDGAGRLLLIKRGHEPGKGLWSIPGGRIEPGESDESALVREVREETGLIVAAGRLIGAVTRPAGGPGGSGAVLDIRDYAAEVTGGTLVPGDDAEDAVWADAADLNRLPLTDGLLDALRSWGAL